MTQNTEVDWSEIDEQTHQEMVKGELNHPNFKKWFSGLLKETTVTVTFFKVNGEQRIMDCTLDESKIPNEKLPKGTSKKTPPTDSIAVFDTQKQDWRSFRFDAIKEFDYDLPEDCDYPATPQPVMFDDEGNEVEMPTEYVVDEEEIIDVESKQLH
jgi:hypothetical protein